MRTLHAVATVLAVCRAASPAAACSPGLRRVLPKAAVRASAASGPPPYASVAQRAPPARASAARELDELGFAVLRGGESVIDRSLCARVALESRERLELLLTAADDAGCNVLEQQYSFAEICHRKRLRWDMRMPASEAWVALCDAALREVAPTLRELCAASARVGAPPPPPPRVVMSGVVLSRAGADAQRFHADGGSRLFNVFVPLVDIAAESDGTQFWPGSHALGVLEEASRAQPADAETLRAMVSPRCAAGGLLVFDYRVLHRGLPNTSRERAVAYIVVATDDTHADAHNFPARTVYGCAADVAEAMPLWDGALANSWRAQQPRVRAAIQRLSRAIARKEDGAHGDDDAHGAWRRAKASVRAHCDRMGRDRWSSQAQLLAANELLAAMPPQ